MRKEKQKRILLVRTDRIGDTVMITPMPREIKKVFPDAFIGTLAQPQQSQIFYSNPHVDMIITDDLKKDSFWKVVKEIRKHKFTHVLLPLPFERDTYQVFLAGIPKRIGSGHKLFQRITFMSTVSRNKYVPLRHEAEYCMDLARAIGVNTTNITPEIFVTEEEKAEANKLLGAFGILSSDKKIIVHTSSGGSDTNWSEEKYFELIKELLKKFPEAKLILTAKEMSVDFQEKIKNLDSDSIFDFTNHLPNLRDMIKLISQCDILISNSTGPMHIASALKVKTVSIFCHRAMSRPARWGALGDKAFNIEVPANVCDELCSADKQICCIEKGISVVDVTNAVEKQTKG